MKVDARIPLEKIWSRNPPSVGLGSVGPGFAELLNERFFGDTFIFCCLFSKMKLIQSAPHLEQAQKALVGLET